MIKHPGPWTEGNWGHVYDANQKLVCVVQTDDPETRIVLLHALDMFEALKYWASQKGVAWDLDDVIDSIAEDVAKIEDEIAGKGTP